MSQISVPVIAIDGVAGSGKGTVRRKVAEILGWNELDSGILYRIVAYISLYKFFSSKEEFVKASHLIKGVIMSNGKILYEGINIAEYLRLPIIDEFVPKVAAIEEVRSSLREIQMGMRKPPGLVAEGRDMCFIFDSSCKFFLTASAEERARRRVSQMSAQGVFLGYREVLKAVLERDFQDSTRKASPLKIHPDALKIDTTFIKADKVAQIIIENSRF
ncbi:MAG: (d)CMP kinase [Candidatus Paceibacterota bacterium]